VKPSSPQNLEPAIRASLENADRLFEDSQNLLEYGRYPTSYALAILAREEYAKTFLLYLVKAGAVPWNSEICQVLRNHTCKQLVAAIMDHLEAEWAEYLATLKLRGHSSFPPHVTDAIHIIRYEKTSKDSDSSWLWDESPCDPQARRLADGWLDRQKQNALYVDVGKTGQVSSTPVRINEKEANAEFENTKRLRDMFSRFNENVEIVETIEYQRIADTFRVLFGLITPEEYSKRM
jgi:AbiV family abortive infection protein